MTGIANIALLSEETGRIFGLDAQLLFDILIQGLAVFLLFIFLTYVLINPVRKVLEDRQNKIKDDLSHAATDRAEAEKLRAEYDEKIKNANSEAGEILSSARTCGEERGKHHCRGEGRGRTHYRQSKQRSRA